MQYFMHPNGDGFIGRPKTPVQMADEVEVIVIPVEKWRRLVALWNELEYQIGASSKAVEIDAIIAEVNG
jgi:hypothetical protein